MEHHAEETRWAISGGEDLGRRYWPYALDLFYDGSGEGISNNNGNRRLDSKVGLLYLPY